jgi:glyoxylase-like metal-dependent hydrolase (beta-lactamase superfamily II)
VTSGPARPSLTELAPGVYGWLQGAVHGMPNAGVVVDADGLTVIDTLMVPSQTEPFAEAIEAWGLPIRRVVLSGSHIPFTGGTSRFWQAAFYGTQTTSELLDLPPNVAGYRLLHPRFAAEFADDLATRPVSHTVDRPAWLTAALEVTPLPGPQRENLLAVLPAAGVCFAGALASFAMVPLAFEADLDAWATSLDHVADLGLTVVPGHGPVGGPADAADLAAYLRACIAAGGDLAALAPGPWDRWAHPEFHAVNVERAALLRCGEDRVPAAMLRLIGLQP